MKRFSALLSLLLLSGCVPYASDPLVLSPCAPSATWTPLRGNRLVSSRFCEMLVPPEFGKEALSLAELIDIGLQNNPRTQQTWASARIAAAQYGQTLSKFFPNVTFDGSLFRQKATFIDTTGAVEPYFATQVGPDLELTFTLFDFGQRTAGSLAAREALYYADWVHNQEIQIVIQLIMDDYYAYLYSQAALEGHVANLENAQMTLDAANERFILGLAALGDVAQARTQFLQNKIELTSQRQELEAAFARLAVHLGLPAHLPFRVVSWPEKVMAAPLLSSLDQLVATAVEKRPDFLAAQANIRSKEALLLGAKRANWPVVGTSLDVGRYWFDHDQSENFFHWSATFSLTFPIFDGYNNRNAIRAAAANVKLSQAQALEVELGIVQEVTVAHMGVKTAAENLHNAEEYVTAASLEFEVAFAGYKEGTKTILDVVSAQSNLADARTKCAGTKRDWFVSLAALAFATGSLCEGEESCAG